MRRLAFIDVETDGLDPLTRQPWEIAMIISDSDSYQTETLSFLVDLEDYSQSDETALRIGRFEERHPHGRRLSGKHALFPVPEMLSEKDAALAVLEATTGATIVGAQPSFDTITLERLLRKHGLEPAWHYRLRDVESMVAGRLRLEPGGLQECARLMGIPSPPKDQHTALGDAMLARHIYHAIITDEGSA